MSPLAPGDVVAIWETGGSQPEWGKAIVVLSAMFPDAPPGELAAMTLGERNAHLLAMHRDVFGPVMQAAVNCPACGEPLEFEQRIDELLADYATPTAREFTVGDGEYATRFRLLTGDDLAHVTTSPDDPAGRTAQIERAILGVTRGDVSVAVADMPTTLLRRVAEDMADRDPLVTIAIPLACAACGHMWLTTFDIVAFLWAEIDRQARRTLDDVVRIAQAYGWSEADILGMSPARRQYYLDAIS